MAVPHGSITHDLGLSLHKEGLEVSSARRRIQPYTAVPPSEEQLALAKAMTHAVQEDVHRSAPKQMYDVKLFVTLSLT